MRLGADCFINTHPATATATATAAATVLEHDEHQLQDSYLHGEILHKRSSKTIKRDRFWRRSQRRRAQTLPDVVQHSF